jgi:hypothetical protein
VGGGLAGAGRGRAGALIGLEGQEVDIVEWYVGFALGMLAALVASALRKSVPPSRRAKVKRPWWYTRDQWDRARGYTEEEYRAWRKIQARKEREYEAWKRRAGRDGKD